LTLLSLLCCFHFFILVILYCPFFYVLFSFFFFFNDPAPTEIYTLSLHDALPISFGADGADAALGRARAHARRRRLLDRRAPARGVPARRRALRVRRAPQGRGDDRRVAGRADADRAGLPVARDRGHRRRAHRDRRLV